MALHIPTWTDAGGGARCSACGTVGQWNDLADRECAQATGMTARLQRILTRPETGLTHVTPDPHGKAITRGQAYDGRTAGVAWVPQNGRHRFIAVAGSLHPGGVHATAYLTDPGSITDTIPGLLQQARDNDNGGRK